MLSGWPGDPTYAKSLSTFNLNYTVWTEAQFYYMEKRKKMWELRYLHIV